MAVIIGITTSFEDGQQRIHHTYVEAIEQAGGIPVLIPMVTSKTSVERIVDLIDGLVVTGGPAITQGLIGTLPDDIEPAAPLRVESDHVLLDLFEQAAKPVLGICYGMQLLNARAGGTIYADVQAQRDQALVHSSVRNAPDHPIHIEPATVLFDVLKTSSLMVNTRHIQAIAEVGTAFRVAATAPDGIPEAIENEDGSIVGVQFHPERMGETMRPLFQHFIERSSQPHPLNTPT